MDNLTRKILYGLDITIMQIDWNYSIFTTMSLTGWKAES